MSVPDPTESRPSTNVHARPSPPEERPSQRIRREDEPQITRLSLYGHRHFVSYPPFTPHNSPRPVPYDTLGQDAKQVDLERNNIGHAAGSGAMPAIESFHDTLQTNPGISEDELIDQQVDQLIASRGPIREGVFDNLGAILAPYQPGYSGGLGLDVNGSGNPTQQFQGATGSTPQMATQQSADWSCSEGVSASSSFRLAISSVIHISKRIPIISTSHFGRSRDRSDNTASPTFLRLSLVQVLPPTLRLHPTLNLIRSAITLMLVSVPPCVHPIRQVWQGHSRHQISLRWRPYRVASPVCQHRRQHRATRPTHNLCPLLR
jgi:hypothetical protein